MSQSTPEQDNVRRIRSGTNAIGANAGTGKTHSLSELVLEIYLAEERLLFPVELGHVGGEDQRTILRQITPITFTRDAAKELSDRTLKLFVENGIPVPTEKWGDPWPLCRTLDSYILRWFKKQIVFDAWLKIDPDFSISIARALMRMTPAVAAQLPTGKKECALTFFRRWNWMVGPEVLDFILDAIIRDSEEGAAVPGITPLVEWEAEWADWFGSFTPPANADRRKQAPWGAEFWEMKIAPYRAFQREMFDLKERYAEGKLAQDPDLTKHVERMHAWDQVQATKREFRSAYELARARGYHPMRHKERMVNLAVLRELAAGDHVFTFQELHRISLRLYSAKVMFMMLDHTDLLNLFVEATEANMAILERNSEYPKLGIRSKYALFDEAQDNNQFQNRIVELWVPNRGVPYCVVVCGDVKQAIYGFKGASTYGFAQLIERIRKNTPENFFTLTCSFRSLRSIVDFGNAIVTKLPHYRATVHPSTTIYTEEGSVVVFPPVATPEDEAVVVYRRVDELLRSTSDSIMLLLRNNLRDHPIYRTVNALNNPRVTLMTIHRSKGLQAEHVFVMGLTAGVLLDARSSFTQEVNLFYVACTRARKALYLSAPFTKESIDKQTGLVSEREVGPSVFFFRLEPLRVMADRAGWPTPMLQRGENYMREAAGFHMARTEAHERQLRRWWQTYYPDIPMADAEDEKQREETGGGEPPPEIRALPRRTIWEDGQIKTFAGPAAGGFQNPVEEGKLRDRVYTRLRECFLKNGEVPRNLKREEFMTALRSHWIVKGSSGRSEFTTGFIQLARQPLPAATVATAV